MRYLIRFSYDGTDFYGYQKQPNKRTVEGCFEEALYHINNKKATKFVSSGRTDKRVHANDQTAHFDLDITITLHKLKRALNSLLSDDIHVFSTEIVSDEFHARYSVKEKTYKYIINCGEYNPVERNYVYQHNKKLDVKKMKNAISHFIGYKDFKNFVSAEVKKENYYREIFKAYIEEKDDKVYFYFTGTGFMKYQVRNMVGTLLKIGMNKLEEDIIQKIFKDDSLAKYVSTIKAEGLYLEQVLY